MAIIVCAGTLVWPVGRWAMQKDGKSEVFGFWISVAAAFSTGIILLVMRKPFFVPGVWVAGLWMGIAYSIGFCVLIMGALKVGPTSLTVTLNNMAMLFGVVYGTVWINRSIPGIPVVAGVIGVCLSLVMIGVSTSQKGAVTTVINRRWLAMVIPGSAFSGMSFITQTHVGMFYPRYSALFVFSGFTISALILLIFVLSRKGKLYRPPEFKAGILIGSTTSLVVSLMLVLIHLIGAEIVLPVTVALPIIIMLLIGHYVYHERLSRYAVTGCIIGAISVALLACGSA
jgi:drug/metabolite transporter (DMT)-like permease